MGLVKKEKDLEESKSEIVDILEVTVSPKDGTITDKNGVQYTLSTLNPELKPTLFINGKSYKVEVVKGKGGTLYIQKIIGEMTEKKITPSESKTESPKPYVDLRGKDLGNRGFIQAAANAASNFSLNIEELEKNMRSVLVVMDKLLSERNG